MKKIYLFVVLAIVFMGGWSFVEYARYDKALPAKQVTEKIGNAKPIKRGEEIVLEKFQEVPVVMYHYVRNVDKNADPLGWNLSINPEDFEKQIAWLKEKGYKSMHLKDLIDGKVPDNGVVLTFDDGLEDFYTTALPILKKYGFTASNGIVTGLIGGHEHMNEQQIKECIKAGIEITSHTIGHIDLSTANEGEVRKQLKESKDFLKDNFAVETDAFVYPSGKYNDLVVRVLGEEGYKIAVTTEYGEADLQNDNLLLLPRIRIDNRDGFKGFVAKMEALKL